MFFGGPIFKHFQNEDELFQQRMQIAFYKFMNLSFILFDESLNLDDPIFQKKVGDLLNQYLFEMMQTKDYFKKVATFMRQNHLNITRLRDLVKVFGVNELIEEEIMTKTMLNWGLIVEKDLGMKLTCSQCDNATEQVCDKCGCTLYCSRRCQKKDWKEHKEFCKLK